MEVVVKSGKAVDAEAEILLLTFFEGEEDFGGAEKAMDEHLSGTLSRRIESKDFEGKLHQISVAYNRAEEPVKRIMMVGLGKKDEFNLEKLRGAFARAAQQARNMNLKSLTSFVNVRAWSLGKFKVDELTEAVVEGVLLGLYQYTRYKTVDREKIKELETFILLEEQPKLFPAVSEAARKSESVSRAVSFARDLVSAPANEMTPSILADQALEMASSRRIKATVFDPDRIRELGMNALLAVAQGCHEPARFIILDYQGAPKKDKPLVLVGKGITFDSGGISLKPAENMGEMKSDMAGAAAVIATLMAAADLELPVNLVGLVPATENLPGGCAYRPGDVLKSLSGKTIEVISTDAEGRLILADALTYAGNYSPEAVIDVATLTGACVVALADIAIGMFGTDTDLKREMTVAGEKTWERVWEMPLWDEYSELIKSDVADYKNTGGRYGGAVTAAAFLRNFAGEYPWVHLDIAGPAWSAKDRPYVPKGASGIGVRLLISWLRNRVK